MDKSNYYYTHIVHLMSMWILESQGLDPKGDYPVVSKNVEECMESFLLAVLKTYPDPDSGVPAAFKGFKF